MIDSALRLLAEDLPPDDSLTFKTPSERKHFRETFRTTWLTLSEIGQQFNLSAIKTGKILVEMGLRDPDRLPSDFALVNGYCWQVDESRYNGEPYYLWHAEKTTQAIADYLNPDTAIL